MLLTGRRDADLLQREIGRAQPTFDHVVEGHLDHFQTQVELICQRHRQSVLEAAVDLIEGAFPEAWVGHLGRDDERPGGVGIELPLGDVAHVAARGPGDEQRHEAGSAHEAKCGTGDESAGRPTSDRHDR